MKPVETREAVSYGQEVFEGLAFFAFLKSTDPKKKAALERLTLLRLKVQEELDIIVPGYMADWKP